MELSAHLVSHLTAKGYDVVDHGPKVYDAQDDYPSFCINAALAVVADQEAGSTRPRHRARRLRQRRADRRQQGQGRPGCAGLEPVHRHTGPRAQRRQRRRRRRPPAQRGGSNGHHRGIPAAEPFSNDERHVRRIGKIAAYETHRRGHRVVPEGHSVHRLARQFGGRFPGERLAVSSPQGRFAARRGAAGRPHPGRHRGPRQAPVPALRPRAACSTSTWASTAPGTSAATPRSGAPPASARPGRWGSGKSSTTARQPRCSPPTVLRVRRAARARRCRPRPAGRRPRLGRPPRRHHLRCDHRGRGRRRPGPAGSGPAAQPAGDQEGFVAGRAGPEDAPRCAADGPEGDRRRRERLPRRTAVPPGTGSLAARHARWTRRRQADCGTTRSP